MIGDSPRDVADMLATFRDEAQQRVAERNPQGPANLLKQISETVVASDTVSATETPVEDATVNWSDSTAWGESVW